MKKNISIVVSLFNEEKSINDLAKSLLSTLTQLKNLNFEIIWVNDGSTDNTDYEINKIAQTCKTENITHLKINFSRNFGHEAAMISGIDNASGDAIICMDADGQHPPSEIPNMISAYLKGNEFVLMSRVQRADSGFFKKILSLIFYKIINYLSSITFEKNASDFFLISNNIASILKVNYREKNRFIRGFIQSIGFTNCKLDYSAPKRMHGMSHYSYIKLFKLALSAIFTFSFKPLRLSVIIAFIFIFTTFFLVVYSVYQYIYGNTDPSGYTTIILFMSFSFTILFTILSIQLLYFEKLIEEVRQTPIYIVKNKQNYDK